MAEFDVPKNRLNQIDQDDCIDLEANDFNLVIDEEGFSSALEDFKSIETLAESLKMTA